MSDPDWAADINPHVRGEIVHAIGVFTLLYNELEVMLFGFFQHYAAGDSDAKMFLFGTMNNSERVAMLKHWARQEPDRKLAEEIEFAVRAFNICCETRNVIAHAVPAESTPGVLTVWKVKSSDPSSITVYDVTLKDIRYAAVSAHQMTDFVVGLLNRLNDKPDAAIFGGAKLALPTRPPQPRKLVPRPPEAGPPTAHARPGSSGP